MRRLHSALPLQRCFRWKLHSYPVVASLELAHDVSKQRKYAHRFNPRSNLHKAVTSRSASSLRTDDPIIVRIVSINDVYDLTKLPRLATLLRSLGSKKKSSKTAPDAPLELPFPNITPSAITLSGDFLSPSALSSIDNGRGHVAAFRAAGITHVSLGNHEADLPLDVLKERFAELGQRGKIVVLNSNVHGLGRHTKEADVVESQCGRVKVGLMGLLSDEAGLFRDGTFRGLPIGDVKKSYEAVLKRTEGVDSWIPLTHQTLASDIQLAKKMMDIQARDQTGEESSAVGGVILGGHEHVKIHESVSCRHNDDHRHNKPKQVHIVKTGFNSERVAIVDLQFDPSNRSLQKIDVHFEELDERYTPCSVVNSIIAKHSSALKKMQDFVVLDVQTMLSDYFVDPRTAQPLPLSSEFTRYEQTTVGAFFCTAIQSELNTDVCIINGAPIKASKIYVDGTMSYDQLQSELPFPLKMVVVYMTRKQLREAIEYSRTHVEAGKPAAVLDDGRIERRGFLQTDFDYWRQSMATTSTNVHLNDEELISVAMPRNLLKGFCENQPLISLREELESKNTMPSEHDYMKAIDLIVRFCCKDRWVSIAKQFSFSELDFNKDGTLDRDEIRNVIKMVLGEEPSQKLVDGMVHAMDNDSSGNIDEKEFNEILKNVTRQLQ